MSARIWLASLAIIPALLVLWGSVDLFTVEVA